MKILKFKIYSVIGLDITVSGLKFIELSFSSNRQSFYIEKFGWEPLTPDAMTGHRMNAPVIAEHIKQLFSKNTIKTRHLVLALPDSMIITKIIQLPHDLNEFEIESLIRFNTIKYLSYTTNEIHFDFKILGPSSCGNDMVDISIIAAKKDPIHDRITIAKLANLDLQVIEIESHAVERLMKLFFQQLQFPTQQKIIALVDFGVPSTRIFIFYEMNIIFTHEMHLQSIDCWCSEHELMEMFFYPIKHVFESFFYSTSYDHLDAIFLSGESRQLNDLLGIFQREIIQSSRIIEPLNCLNNRLSKLDGYHEPFLVASGLALRGLAM